jgi:hypothetical protein
LSAIVSRLWNFRLTGAFWQLQQLPMIVFVFAMFRAKLDAAKPVALEQHESGVLS